MFRLMFRDSAKVELLAGEYTAHDLALTAAEAACRNIDRVVLIVQDVSEVKMAPTVVNLSVPPTPSGPVYRGVPRPDDEPEGPPRAPQAKPRLLVVDRKATPAEVTGYLMVVAEGRIVKNAFGGLELDDMPLSLEERTEVASALLASKRAA